MCVCFRVCVGFSCQPLVHSGALEDPQELDLPLQAGQVVGQGLERGNAGFRARNKSRPTPK